MIYLDNNATTPVDPEVSDAVFSSLRRDVGNPSSGHLWGRRTKEVIENARENVAALLGCRGDEIFFTSGGTESNNLALIGTSTRHKSGHVITSSIEHPSVLNTCRYLSSLGFEITCVPADSDGIVKASLIGDAIRKNTVLISLMHSNNETGVIQTVEEIGEIARGHGIPFHVDAAQSIGKMHVSIAESPVDMMTIVSHKFYGPKGIGAIFVRKGSDIRPIFFGAGHEGGLRPGTENVAGIAGFGKACQLAKRDIRLRVTHTTRLRDMLLHDLKTGIPDLELNGHRTKRLPTTLNIRIPGTFSYELVEFLKDEVAFSAGSACHSGVHRPSDVLKSMGLSDDEALSSVRLSVGKDNTEEEMKSAAGSIIRAVRELRKQNISGK